MSGLCFFESLFFLIRYLSYLERAQKTDLSEFDKMGVVYHSGRDAVIHSLLFFEMFLI